MTANSSVQNNDFLQKVQEYCSPNSFDTLGVENSKFYKPQSEFEIPWKKILYLSNSPSNQKQTCEEIWSKPLKSEDLRRIIKKSNF